MAGNAVELDHSILQHIACDSFTVAGSESQNLPSFSSLPSHSDSPKSAMIFGAVA